MHSKTVNTILLKMDATVESAQNDDHGIVARYLAMGVRVLSKLLAEQGICMGLQWNVWFSLNAINLKYKAKFNKPVVNHGVIKLNK